MNLTKKQAVEEHRKMWNWIADETIKRKTIVTKEMYFREVYPDNLLVPRYFCFCCEYVISGLKEYSMFPTAPLCLICPIEWPCEKFCGSSPSPFLKWKATVNYKKAAKYARMIAELPEREDMEFDNI